MASSIGRLWRRAPAWRFCIFMGVAFAALTALFPPALPRFGRRTTLAVTAPQAAPPAHFAPVADGGPRNYATVSDPALGAGQSGTIRFAGRQVPLPASETGWQRLEDVLTNDIPNLQVTVLDQVTDGTLAGLLLLVAPTPVGATGLLASPPSCFAPAVLAHGAAPEATTPDAGMAHECWTLAATTLPAGHAAATAPTGVDSDPALHSGMDRLAALGVTVPPRMALLQLVRSAPNGWLILRLYVPATAIAPAQLHRTLVWVADYVALAHRGFDGALASTEAAAALPGSARR